MYFSHHLCSLYGMELAKKTNIVKTHQDLFSAQTSIVEFAH